MGRLHTEAEGALALRGDFLDLEMLMQADPTTFFITDHYNDYPRVRWHQRSGTKQNQLANPQRRFQHRVAVRPKA